MRFKVMMRIAAYLLVLGWACGNCLAEVSTDNSPAMGSKSLVLIYELTAGADDPDPWPIYRLHIPVASALNPNGSDGPTPDGWPSLGWDPIRNVPEVTWARHDGEDYEISISHWEIDHWTAPEDLTSNSIDDFDPELAYAPDGTARITYWSDGQVYWISRPPSGSWASPETVDAGVESSVAGSAKNLVAYQQPVNPTGAEIVVAERKGIWVPTTLATTSFEGLNGSGELDVRLHYVLGKTWVDWENSASFLGWCELLQGGGWSAPFYEAIADDEEAGRQRIQSQVLRGH